MKLKKVTIHKFKSINTDQSINIEDDITILVGMNESGKTACLEAIAKTNYHQKGDKLASFLADSDYPRIEKKKFDKGKSSNEAITCEYRVDEETGLLIDQKICPGILGSSTIKKTHTYKNRANISIEVNYEPLHELIISKLEIPEDKKHIIIEICNRNTYNSAKGQLSEDFDLSEFDYLLGEENSWNWENFLGEYIYRNIIAPKLPKFLYYDEYYSLPHRVSIEDLSNNEISSDDHKTAKALFELADIDKEKLLNSNSFESFKSELEATSAEISRELFRYWSANNSLEIIFDIDKKIVKKGNNHSVQSHILDIRVKNKNQGVSLPLTNRSKGFNWFFSFLVWFKKIQEDEDSSYILLLGNL